MKIRKFLSKLNKLLKVFGFRGIFKMFTFLILIYILGMVIFPVFLFGKTYAKVSYGTDDRYRYERWLPDNYTRHLPKVEGTVDDPPYTQVPLVTHNIICIDGYAFYLVAAYKMNKDGKIVLINNAIYPQYEFINGMTIPLICK